MPRVCWFDLLCLSLAGAALLLPAAEHAGLRPALALEEVSLLGAGVLVLPAVAAIGAPLMVSLSCGVLFVRLPWRLGLGLTGVGLLALVVAAWRAERAATPAFDVMPPAVALVLVFALGALVRARRTRRGPTFDPASSAPGERCARSTG